MCKLPDSGDWQCEKLGLALMGRALLSKALIQSSADGWGCVPSLLVVWPEVTQSWVYGHYGRVNGDLQKDLHQGGTSEPGPCDESLPTHASTGDPPTLAGSFGSVSCGVTAPFLWLLVCTRFCLCPPRLESLFPSVLWKSYNQIPLAFTDSLGIPSPFVRSPGWED